MKDLDEASWKWESYSSNRKRILFVQTKKTGWHINNHCQILNRSRTIVDKIIFLCVFWYYIFSSLFVNKCIGYCSISNDEPLFLRFYYSSSQAAANNGGFGFLWRLLLKFTKTRIPPFVVIITNGFQRPKPSKKCCSSSP